MTSKAPDAVDMHVGSRVRMCRLDLRMSQEKLADELGITFQQVQKYEKGTNRIAAGRLQQIARILRVPAPFFFEGAPQAAGRVTKRAEPPSFSYVDDFLATADGLRLVKAFAQIGSPALRRSVVRVVEELDGDTEMAPARKQPGNRRHISASLK